MIPGLILKVIATIPLLLLPGFFLYSPTSAATKLLVAVMLSVLGTYSYTPELVHLPLFVENTYILENRIKCAIMAFVIVAVFKHIQYKLRFARINTIKKKFGYTKDPQSWKDMTVEQAQEIEANMAEWEFPRLYMFAWISDFLRTSTDPGVSRALVKSGHMVNVDPMVEHDRLQATIHLMSGMMAYKFGSPEHSLVISRINEHHHRYGTWINSDDVLYLVIHFAMSPVTWINKFGYRKLEDFEVQAMWVLWRELGCRMGVKYIPKTIEQAREWRSKFEKTCRWRDDANEVAGMAMMNEIIYSVPSILKPFTRKLIVSILDWDIVHFCKMEKLGRDLTLRAMVYDLFTVSGQVIRHFGLPRLSPYKRTPDGANKTGGMNFGHTPYDTLPFFQERSFWNLFGYGALLRRLNGMPMPSHKFFSDGVAIESMGALQNSAKTQAAVEKKVRENAAILEKAPYGYRPAIGYQTGRLLGPVEGPSYGLDMNTFPESTVLIPASAQRFEKEFERRSQGYSKLGAIDKPEDVAAFDESEVGKPNTNGIHLPSTVIQVSA